jgi:hypothetical protein
VADSSNSLLKTVIERIRGFLDDPDLEAKYSDDYLVRHIIAPSFATIMSRINNSTSSPVLKRLSFPIVSTERYYQLPPCVGEVWRLAILDNNGYLLQEALPRGMYNVRGSNWQIEGNIISFYPFPDGDYSDLELWYCPSGDYNPIYISSGTGHTLSVDKKSITFATSTVPTLGSWDRRPNAYVGQIVRLLPSAVTGVVEERMIDSWAPSSPGASTWVATLRTPFVYAASGTLSAGGFEIAPEGSEPLYEAMAAGAALKLSSYRKLSGEHFGMVQAQYRDAMKTLLDHYSNVQMRMPKAWERDTVDNQVGQHWRI